MGLVNIFINVETDMKENLKMEKEMVKEHFILLEVIDMKESLKMTQDMVKEFYIGVAEIDTMVNFIMIKEQVEEQIILQMEHILKVSF